MIGLLIFIAIMLVFVSFQAHSIMLELIEIHGSIRRIRK